MLNRLFDGEYLSGYLTARERQVYWCLGRGMSNPEIAEELTICLSTVYTHVSRILGKVGVKNRGQAGILAAVEATLRDWPEKLMP